MYKYYLFCIKKDYYQIYKNKSYVLYKIIENLYNLEAYDFSYGINVFRQLCNQISVKLLNNYIKNRINHKKINNNIIMLEGNGEKTYLEIKYSCIIIYTNKKFPLILKIFNIYNRNIFACDFKSNDYFWLNNISKNIGKYNK